MNQQQRTSGGLDVTEGSSVTGGHHHVDLIDTTEMYLRTVYELEEEGIVALRARIAERLGQSGPTVSQTVARMERDGLLHVESDRHLSLSETGRRRAVSVMRKHRLAERLLADIIGLPWEQVHVEACRWEHVMSDAVERRIVALLDKPLVCPHGNPIPGLHELGLPFDGASASEPAQTMEAVTEQGATSAVIARISEHLQADEALMRRLSVAGVVPGHSVTLAPAPGGVQINAGAKPMFLSTDTVRGIFVSVPVDVSTR